MYTYVLLDYAHTHAKYEKNTATKSDQGTEKRMHALLLVPRSTGASFRSSTSEEVDFSAEVAIMHAVCEEDPESLERAVVRVCVCVCVCVCVRL